MILKWPIIENVDYDLKNNIYLIITIIQSQKKNLKAKKFQPILQVIKPTGRNSKKLFRNQT